MKEWLTTYKGLQFWPLNPDPKKVCIDDIAHALSLICRFGGHCTKFYSVAQHSCLVADLVTKINPKYTLYALLHDAAEAYVGDVISPIKKAINFDIVEDRVMMTIYTAFELIVSDNCRKVVKWADDILLKNEQMDLITGWPKDNIINPRIQICPVPSDVAESNFLNKYEIWKTKT